MVNTDSKIHTETRTPLCDISAWINSEITEITFHHLWRHGWHQGPLETPTCQAEWIFKGVWCHWDVLSHFNRNTLFPTGIDRIGWKPWLIWFYPIHPSMHPSIHPSIFFIFSFIIQFVLGCERWMDEEMIGWRDDWMKTSWRRRAPARPLRCVFMCRCQTQMNDEHSVHSCCPRRAWCQMGTVDKLSDR